MALMAETVASKPAEPEWLWAQEVRALAVERWAYFII